MGHARNPAENATPGIVEDDRFNPDERKSGSLRQSVWEAATALERRFPYRDAHADLACLLWAKPGNPQAEHMSHPGRIARLILQECHTRGRLAGDPSPERLHEAQARLKVIELGWPNETPAYAQFFAALHIPDSNAAQMQAYNNLLRKMTSPANALGLLKTFWETDVSAIVPQVNCPTLVLHSRGDSVIPFDEGRTVAAQIPRARFVPLDSRNHLLLENEPAWPRFVEVLVDFLATNPPDIATSLIDGLTPREREVLAVLAEGLDNRAIAAHLKITEETTRNHVSAIFGKLGVSNRAQAVALARDIGFRRT